VRTPGVASRRVTASGGVHVVWDWNGTLFDDHAAVMTAVNRVLGDAGLGPIDSDTYRASFRMPVKLLYDQLFGHALDADEWSAVNRRWHAAYDEALTGIGLAADAVESLDRVRAGGCAQSLLSMHFHERIEAHLRAFGVADRFAVVDGVREWHDGSKSERLAAHLVTLGRPDPETVVMVGDALDDAVAAESVGARIVLYDGGSHHVDHLRATGHPVAHTLMEALDLAGL
jgi:phosphoglycolate phosphatase-like HAD superfamily hydrolase